MGVFNAEQDCPQTRRVCRVSQHATVCHNAEVHIRARVPIQQRHCEPIAQEQLVYAGEGLWAREGGCDVDTHPRREVIKTRRKCSLQGAVCESRRSERQREVRCKTGVGCAVIVLANIDDLAQRRGEGHGRAGADAAQRVQSIRPTCASTDMVPFEHRARQRLWIAHQAQRVAVSASFFQGRPLRLPPCQCLAVLRLRRRAR